MASLPACPSHSILFRDETRASMDRQGRVSLCFLWVVSQTMARTQGGAAGAESAPCTSFPLGAVGT